MWNNAVLDLHTDLLTAFRPLAAIGHAYPMTTVGVTLLFVILVAMLAAEVADSRDVSARTHDTLPYRLDRSCEDRRHNFGRS